MQDCTQQIPEIHLNLHVQTSHANSLEYHLGDRRELVSLVVVGPDLELLRGLLQE